MRVYLTGERQKSQPVHRMLVAPAADLRGQEVPVDWVDDENTPVTLTVEFHFGVAEVDTGLGKYLVSRGLAARSKLILPFAA